MALYGVDGCRDGWIIASSTTDSTSEIEFRIVADLGELIGGLDPRQDLLVIDVPIGLPEDGPRRCDLEARRMLGRGRGSSVFPSPMRPTLAASTYSEACAINETHSGKRISLQTFGIMPKIADVDRIITPGRQDFVREAHPEVTFMLLAGLSHGLTTKKKRSEGRLQRIEILRCVLPPFDYDAFRAAAGRRRLAPDDLIDAVACLATAARIRAGTATTLPSGHVERDGRGLRMEIVA